jgi:hypothetical protein
MRCSPRTARACCSAARCRCRALRRAPLALTLHDQRFLRADAPALRGSGRAPRCRATCARGVRRWPVSQSTGNEL